MNKIAIVTGANSGIGKEIAKQLVANNIYTILACRNEKQGKEVEKYLGEKSKYLHCDLANFESMEKFCHSINSQFENINYLFNNGGIFLPPYKETHEGYELTYGVNYLSYFYLTNSLIHLMKKVPGSRIINTSSLASFRPRTLNIEQYVKHAKFNRMKVYEDSTLMRSMFTYELDNRLKDKKYETIAVSGHPGVVLTNIQKYSLKLKMKYMLLNRHHNVSKGAAPLIKAGLDASIKGKDFVGLDTLKQHKGNPLIIEHPNKIVLNKELRNKLWNHSVSQTDLDLK
jgi:NAD(P)-dependent dehydrogenase (short-subunit alcohol dehydrogenase family)